jgi:predicted CXXCH cytochrome family protein
MRAAVAFPTLVAVMLAVAASGAAGQSRTPQPVIERAAKGSQCVGDPEFMRRNHMDLLKHQRELTVRQGVRNAPYSLKACVECHASRETGSVTKAPTNFCVSCHTYAGVKINCFQCHASQPQAEARR